MKKLGRNDLCWCGSGKKYKHCHEAFDEKLMEAADAGHQIPDHDMIKTPEQIEDPVTLYRRTLAAQPDRSVTVLSLGFATELAKLLWTEAGKPAPAAVMAEDATDEQKALTWAVESQLISADKPADASVGRWEVIRGWNRVKEMK